MLFWGIYFPIRIAEFMKKWRVGLVGEPIRVLQIVGRMDRGGIENFVMNIYRNIDREKVQFDFLCHYGREAAFNDEIRAMGGRIYEMPAIRDA